MTTDIDRAPSLLQAILDEPDADDLRLIYADWLQDHGEEERAEFIRVQVELARTPSECVEFYPEHVHMTNVGMCPDCERIRVLYPRMEELWYYPAKGFEGQLPEPFTSPTLKLPDPPMPGVAQAEVRRGFVHTIRCDTATWLQHRVELVRRHPIQRVKLTNKEAVLCTRQDGVDVAGKYRWSRFVGGEEGETNHYIGGGLIPGAADMNLGVWSIHDTREEADAWLSTQLIARAMELAAQSPEQ